LLETLLIRPVLPLSDVGGGELNRNMPTPPIAEPPAGLDLAALTSAEDELRGALDRLAVTQHEIDALQARRARELAALETLAHRVEIAAGAPTAKTAEYTHRSLRAEAALALHCSEYAADRLLLDADTLVHRIPRTIAAVEAGLLEWRSATLIAEEARELDRDVRAAALAAAPVLDPVGVDGSAVDALARAAVGAFESEAMVAAATVAPSRLRRRLIALREREQSATAIERHRSARDRRLVTLEDAADGMSWLNAYLPSVEAHAVHRRLTDTARRIDELDDEDGFEDPRTLDQRRADLLVDFLAGDFLDAEVHPSVGGPHDDAHGPADTTALERRRERRAARGLDLGRFAGIRPTVIVTVPVETLLDLHGDSAADPPMLDGTVPIDPATARRLAANAPTLYRMLVHPHTGARLDLGRERYAVPTELRMWLRLRDETCRFPGCGRSASSCDIDHSTDWQHGGETRADNLAHLCRGHHTLKHQTRWALTQHPSGEITWCSPSGRQYSTWPARPFARSG